MLTNQSLNRNEIPIVLFDKNAIGLSQKQLHVQGDASHPD
jgi:hypothetical protein